MASCIRDGVRYKRHKFFKVHGVKGHRWTSPTSVCLKCGAPKIARLAKRQTQRA